MNFFDLATRSGKFWNNGLFLNSKLRVWPPDLPDLANYYYVLTFLAHWP